MENESSAPKRFWAKHKTQAVLILLRGDDLEFVSRDLGVTAVTLYQWRDAFLEAGVSGLKPQSVKVPVEMDRLRTKIGEQAMESGVSREKIDHLEQHRPLAHGR